MSMGVSLTICGVKVRRMRTPLIGNEVLVYPDESCACVQEFSFSAWWEDCKADQWQLKDTLTGGMLIPDVSCGADEASKGEER